MSESTKLARAFLAVEPDAFKTNPLTARVHVDRLARIVESRESEIEKLRAELAELRARVPAICFPRQPNGEGGWVIDANYVAAIHKDCFPIEWQPCEEEVEAVLLAVERAAPVTPAAVPDDVAKDASLSGKEFDALLILLMCSDPWPVGDEENEKTVKAMATRIAKLHGHDDWVDAYHSHAPTDAAAILAADTEGRKDE